MTKSLALRSYLAATVPPVFTRLQRSGLAPDPERARSARRLGARPADAAYEETIVGHHRPSGPIPASDIRPDDDAGQRYADLLGGGGSGTIRPYGYFDVPDAKIWAEFGVHAAPAGNFIDVYCGPALRNPKYELPRLALPAIPARTRHRSAVFLGPAWHHNYYHWIVDILPRIANVADVLADGTPVIVPPGLGGARRRMLDLTLAAAGAEGAEVTVPQNGVHRFDRLVMPTRITDTLDVSALQRDVLRRAVLPHAETNGTRRRLYISRRDAAVRRIANEDEIVPELVRRGFEVVVMSGLSPEAQAGLFRGAEVIVTHHGAALANLAFCDPGTTVIEVFQDGHFAACFARIAQLGRLRYGFGVGRRAGQDTWLDPRQLDALLERAGL
jgi:hypothetical protein